MDIPTTPKPAKEFVSKLKALLKEYDCSINFDCSSGSDLHGISGEKITISQRQGRKDVTIASASGYLLVASDL